MKRIADWAIDMKLEEMDKAFNDIVFMRTLTESQCDKVCKKLNHYKSEFKRLQRTVRA